MGLFGNGAILDLAGEDEISFRIAKMTPELREDYVNGLDWKTKMPFVGSVVYSDNWTTSKSYNISSSVFGKKKNIILYPGLFDASHMQLEQDFFHLLFNHLGYIALEMHNKDPVRHNCKDVGSMDNNGYTTQFLVNERRALAYAKKTLSVHNSINYHGYIEQRIKDTDRLLVNNFMSVADTIENVSARNHPIIKDPIYSLDRVVRKS